MNAPETKKETNPAPKMSLTRRRLLRLMGGGFLALFAGSSLRTWRVLQEPTVTFPPLVLPSPNAYDGYMKAVGLLHKGEDLTDSFRAEYAAPTSENRHQILSLQQKQAVVVQNAPALSALRSALLHSYQEPPKRDGIGIYPQLRPFRILARLCVTDGDIKRETGKQTEAVSAYLDAVQMGQDMVRGGPIITRLVGIANQAIGRRPLWKYLHDLDVPSAKYGARRMEQIIAAHVPMSETWAEEKYFGQAARLLSFRSMDKMAADLFPPSDEGFSGDPPPVSAWQKTKVLGMFAVWSKTRMMDEFVGYMDALIQNDHVPYARRRPVPLPPRPANPPDGRYNYPR